jgi:replication factor C subunit 3/5
MTTMSKLQDFHDFHSATSVMHLPNYNELPLSEALRPRSFQELMLPAEMIEKLSKMVETDQIMNMIFAGRPAAGKTSAARLLQKNCEALFVNASSANDATYIKKNIFSYASTVPVSLKQKIVILDEADYLTKAAQASLRALIEDAYKNCRFILIVNDIKMIDAALISRCMPVYFDIKVTEIDSMISKYIRIVQERLKERSIEMPNQKLNEIVKSKFPDFRAIANEIEFATM